MLWHSESYEDIIKKLETGKNGLNSSQVLQRLKKYGSNELENKNKISVLNLFLSQFKNSLVIILILAALISYYIGVLENQTRILDSILIIGIVLLNGVFGFIQDYKAEKNIEALKDLATSKARVVRNGKESLIDVEDLVPGDIILIEEGDKIPADARIIESINMRIDESALTGESIPSGKISDTIDSDSQLGDMKNIVFSNTNVVSGRGKAVVIKTGMKTEIGKIAEMLGKTEQPETPFQIEVNELGDKIAYGILIIILFVAGFQFFIAGTSLLDTFLISVSLAVAVIPEGLPAVVTLSLALGTQKMLKKNTLVRKLPVIESLGSVEVICTDKTGTLTENKMTVESIYVNKDEYSVTGTGYNEGKIITDDFPKELEAILECGALCNNAKEIDGKYTGDPTEIALLVSAKKGDIHYDYERVKEIPFTSERRMMSVILNYKDSKRLYSKGASEVILEKCDKVLENGEVIPLTDLKRKEIKLVENSMASRALRVIGFAYGEEEDQMTFIGLQGMIDPPRKDVKQALEKCSDAGIRTIMITGDNDMTARAVGKSIGIETDSIEGKEIDKMDDDQLSESIDKINIFSRVTPSHKMRILKILKREKITAMTGDGVNDAPAIKNSDVGISMGIRGTDVSKQSSDMILLDDKFSTIVDAIEEGRTIFNNIKKFVNYLLTSNFSEVVVVFAVSLLSFLFYGNPLIPITATQLLWINVLTDGFPALALGVDPSPPDIMKKSNKKNKVIDKKMLKSILYVGSIISFSILVIFFLYIENILLAQTMVFTGFVFYEFLRIVVIRKDEKLSLTSNKWLILALLAAMLIHLIILYVPFGNTYLFNTVPLQLNDWLLLIGFGIFNYILSIFATKFIKE